MTKLLIYLGCIVAGFVCAYLVLSKSGLITQKPNAVQRVTELRAGGFTDDGLHTLFGPLKVSVGDYRLMGCDCRRSELAYPDVAREDLLEGRWWTAAPGVKPEDIGSLNNHATQGADGEWYLDSFYAAIPRASYQVDPREVAWHCQRVTELRVSGMSRDERIATMAEEAKKKPWLKGGV